MKEYLNYTGKNAADSIIVSLAGLAFLLSGSVLLYTGKLMGLILIFLGVLALCSVLSQMNPKKTGSVHPTVSGDILSDFSSAESLADDSVRLGQIYCFRKKYPHPIRISEVIRADYSEKGTGADDTDAAIFVTLANGKEERLCPLYGADRQEQCRIIFALLKERNPAIACGN